MILFILAAVMILLGTFVDSLIVLLVFAPVAVSVTKTYGLDPFQVGLVMVICNQIGAVSPPTAPLLFITTSIAKTPDRPDQPACLDVHAGRNAGAGAGHPDPRPVVLDPQLLPRPLGLCNHERFQSLVGVVLATLNTRHGPFRLA